MEREGRTSAPRWLRRPDGLCDARLRRGSLWFPIGFHWAGNFVEGVVFGMPTSGQSWSHPLLRYDAGGHPVFTGGAFGPEAGLFMAVAALAALLAMRGWRATVRPPAGG